MLILRSITPSVIGGRHIIVPSVVHWGLLSPSTIVHRRLLSPSAIIHWRLLPPSIVHWWLLAPTSVIDLGIDLWLVPCIVDWLLVEVGLPSPIAIHVLQLEGDEDSSCSSSVVEKVNILYLMKALPFSLLMPFMLYTFMRLNVPAPTKSSVTESESHTSTRRLESEHAFKVNVSFHDGCLPPSWQTGVL